MQDMRNDGFALKQNALGRVLNKNDPNQVSIGSTVIYYELKPTKIFCLFVAAANISQTIYGEVCIACDEIYAFVNEKSLLHIYRLS
jgi:hypothetical protein